MELFQQNSLISLLIFLFYISYFMIAEIGYWLDSCLHSYEERFIENEK